MSYLRYVRLLAHSDVQHILCCVFVFIIFVLPCLTYVPSFSRLSIVDCSFGILTFISTNINKTNKITSHIKSLKITKDHDIGL
jgi:hypothetical protein